MRLIISHRDRPCPQSAAKAAQDLSRHVAGLPGDRGARVRRGLHSISHPGGGKPKSVRLGGGESLLCRCAEERKNAVHLRSAWTAALRERLISACRRAAMLVFEPASGPADGHLTGHRTSDLRPWTSLWRMRWFSSPKSFIYSFRRLHRSFAATMPLRTPGCECDWLQRIG